MLMKILKAILPILAVVILFLYNPLIGLAAMLALLIYLLVTGRAAIYSFLGNAKYGQGKLDASLQWIGRAVKTGKAKPRVVTAYGYLLLKTGNLTEADAVLSKNLKSGLSKDDEMHAKSNYALVLWKKGDLDGAIAMLEELIAEYETSTVYGSLGYFLILKGDLEKALQLNLKAYEYNGSNTVIQDNLGQTYHLMGENEKAAEIYEKLMAANPQFPEAYYNYGLVLEALGQPEKALEIMEKALHHKLSFLSTITMEEIEAKLDELKKNSENSKLEHRI